jgi:hypothetical protein
MAAKLVSLVGHQFGFLTVESYAGFTERRKSKWNCEFRCGRMKVIVGYGLTTGVTRS